MPKMRGYQYMAEFFKRTGVGTIFMFPTNLFATLVELENSGIKIVLVHNEKPGAYMADGYAKASGKPGILITQGGPGATNAAAGLADAYQANSPVIVFTGARALNQANRNAYQEVVAHFEGVTKYQASVLRVDRVPDLFAQAFREATSGAPAPVVLEVLGEAEAAEADLPEPPFLEERFTRYPAFRPEPERDAVREAARLLNEASRPVIVAGGGAIVSEAWDEITQLAEMLSIPVATSLSGKGVIAETHPLAVGVVGSYARASATDIVSSADLVLFIGAHAGGQVTNGWTAPKVGTPVVHIDINPSQIGKNYPTKVGLQGDARVTVQRLIEAVDELPNKAPHNEWANEAQRLTREWWAEMEPFLNSDQAPIRPERLCKELSDCLPRNTLMVADTGYAGAWAGAFWEVRNAGKNFIRCEGSLGWAFPAALGAKCGAPERPVVCFTGDGGFWYHISEIETAVRNNINTVTVVLNNHALVFDTHILDLRWDGRGHILSEFNDVDFAKVAESMGAYGIRVEKPDEIRGAIDKALAANRPAVVDVVIDHEAYAPVRGGRRM